MPLYEYSCSKCRARFELTRPMARRDDPAACPDCGYGKAKRELSRVAALVRGDSGAGISCRQSPGGGFT